MDRPRLELARGLAAASLALASLVMPANAGRLPPPDGDYVVAHSKHGNGSVVGPVRRTGVGLQVKTPGGSWLHCERSCTETLRVNTVDFWQNEPGAGNNAIDQEDGLLSRWLRWDWRR